MGRKMITILLILVIFAIPAAFGIKMISDHAALNEQCQEFLRAPTLQEWNGDLETYMETKDYVFSHHAEHKAGYTTGVSLLTGSIIGAVVLIVIYLILSLQERKAYIEPITNFD